MWKKILIGVGVFLVLMVGIATCGDKDSAKEPEDTKTTKAEEVTIVEITTEETTTVKPTETEKPTTTETEEPTTTTTTEKPTTTTTAPAIVEKKEKIVYITDTGNKYHTGSCRFVKNSKTSITVQEALSQGYEPCGVCNPGR